MSRADREEYELALFYLLLMLAQSDGQLRDCPDVVLQPQMDDKLWLQVPTIHIVKFNSTRITNTTVTDQEYLQTLKDTGVLPFYNYSDSVESMVFNSESFGVISVIPNHICARIMLPLHNPRDPENGSVQFSYEVEGDHILAIAEFECDDGYFLNGSNIRVFQASDRLLSWSGSDPVCEVKEIPYSSRDNQSDAESGTMIHLLWLLVVVVVLIVVTVFVCYRYKHNSRESSSGSGGGPSQNGTQVTLAFQLNETIDDSQADPPSQSALIDDPEHQESPQQISQVASGPPPPPLGVRRRPKSNKSLSPKHSQKKVGKSSLSQPMLASEEDTGSNDRVVGPSDVEYNHPSSLQLFLNPSPSLIPCVAIELDKSNNMGESDYYSPPVYMTQASDEGCTALVPNWKNKDLVANYMQRLGEEDSDQNTPQTTDEVQKYMNAMDEPCAENKQLTNLGKEVEEDQLDKELDRKSSSCARTTQGNTDSESDCDFSGKTANDLIFSKGAIKRWGQEFYTALFLVLMLFLAVCASLSKHQGGSTPAVQVVPLRGKYWLLDRVFTLAKFCGALCLNPLEIPAYDKMLFDFKLYIV